MPDAIHPNDRPLTIPEMFERLAVMARTVNDLETILPGIDHVRREVEHAIERRRPGWAIDQMLGTSKDRPINAETTNV